MKTQTLPMLCLAATVLLVGCEVPPPRHSDRTPGGSYGMPPPASTSRSSEGGWHERERHDRDNDQVRVVFSDRERSMIRDYYDQRRRSLPPGLAKKHKIPPGQERKMYEERMPPGQQNRNLPYDLEGRLPPLPVGYVRVIIDADVAIMNTRTHAIVDVIRGIAGE